MVIEPRSVSRRAGVWYVFEGAVLWFSPLLQQVLPTQLVFIYSSALAAYKPGPAFPSDPCSTIQILALSKSCP